MGMGLDVMDRHVGPRTDLLASANAEMKTVCSGGAAGDGWLTEEKTVRVCSHTEIFPV